MSKTRRILDHLPRTFRSGPRPNAVYSLVDAFGSELLDVENNLALVMAAHWVDFADREVVDIDDLARIAALYGLAPRPDESVEEFRLHLKRYVRTFLEGTVTVEGLLRVAAEVLGLLIQVETLEGWWQRDRRRRSPWLIPARCDAASLLFGDGSLVAKGLAARYAQLQGNVDLSAGVDLREDHFLYLSVDEKGVVPIDLRMFAANPALVTLAEMTMALQVASPSLRVDLIEHRLRLGSPSTGTDSSIELLHGEKDATNQLFGMGSRVVTGRDEAPASLLGRVDLSAGLLLGEARYLRLGIDNTHLFEVDLDGLTQLAAVVDRINDVLGIPVASADEKRLKITGQVSGTPGFVTLLQASTRDAAEALFGPENRFSQGIDEAPARLIGSIELRGDLDLRDSNQLSLALDGAEAVIINCQGVQPGATKPGEIVSAINATMGIELARLRDDRLVLTTESTGSGSQITVGELGAEDAAPLLLGLASRRGRGTAATKAVITSPIDLSEGVNLWALSKLYLNVSGSHRQVDLVGGVSDRGQVRLAELGMAINEAFQQPLASDDGRFLTLQAPLSGENSGLDLRAPLQEHDRAFTSRALITEEAARSVFGFLEAEATGTAGGSARIVGTRRHRAALDLREARYLRVAIDHGLPLEIDCAGPRPRATTLSEVQGKIAVALGTAMVEERTGVLILRSTSIGSRSLLRFEAPTHGDVLPVLGLTARASQGRPADQVRFTSTAIIPSEGISLSDGDEVRIAIDGEEQIIRFAAGTYSLSALVAAINQAFAKLVADHDGRLISLQSRETGSTSQVSFLPATGTDVSHRLFGVMPGRHYQAVDALPAEIMTEELAAELDLSIQRYLRITIDREPTRVIDLAEGLTDPTRVSMSQLADILNSNLGYPAVTVVGNRLRFISQRTGFAGRLKLSHHQAPDAFATIFGDGPREVRGEEATPARLTGLLNLDRPLSLGERDLLRISVDGNRPRDVHVAGAQPQQTFAAEIVAAINEVWPELASLTDDGRLQFTSPTRGSASALQLWPLRAIALSEYEPRHESQIRMDLQHGDRFAITHGGVGESKVSFHISSSTGLVGPGLCQLGSGLSVRVMDHLQPAEAIELCWGEGQPVPQLLKTDGQGKQHLLDQRLLRIAEPGPYAALPFSGWLPLGKDHLGETSLQIDRPGWNYLIKVRAKTPFEGRLSLRISETGAVSDFGMAPMADGLVRMRGMVVEQAGQILLLAGDDHLSISLNTDLAMPPLNVAIWVLARPLDTTRSHWQVVRFGELVRCELAHTDREGTIQTRAYEAVGLGRLGTPFSWLAALLSAAEPWIRGEIIEKQNVFQLPPGRSRWQWLTCGDTRYDAAAFDEASFSGSSCHSQGLFNHARFVGTTAPGSVYAGAGEPARANLRVNWVGHQAGRCRVQLPADLPPKFGGRFNEARFASASNTPEHYPGSVLEPADDPDDLVANINSESALVVASRVETVSLGWEAVTLPFRKPRYLTLGKPDQPARLYINEEGVPGFVQLTALSSGAWGNQIHVTARPDGPARFEVTLTFEGGRFESARSLVLGAPLTPQANQLLKPGPVGLRQAKAAGVLISVDRETTTPDSH